MKRDWSRFAPLGLIIAGLAAFTSFCIYIVIPKLSLWLEISLIVMVVGLVLYVVLAPGQLRQTIKGRHARYGLNAVLLSVAFLGILVVINYLVFYNAKMNPKITRWDLTENKSNTLASETLDTLAKLPEVVHAQAFFSPRGDSTAISDARDLLDKYAKYGKGKFSFEFINWEEKRNIATQAGITADGQIVVNMGDRKELVSVVSEQELTSALVRLLTSEKRSVYFLQDEGEYDPNSTATDATSRGMSNVRDALEGKNYAVKTLKLAVDGMVPQDAQIIVIAGPTQPLSQASVDLLSGYLQNGGSLILMEGPMFDITSGAFPADPLVDYLAKNWGITLGNNVVITLEANQPSLTAVAAAYSNHVITQKMGSYTPSFPGARSVQVATGLSGFNEQELVYTTQNYANCFPACSWATSDINGLVNWYNGKQASPPQSASDLMGPIPIAAAAENTTTQARVVVFGSSDFASNALRAPGNQDLLMNSIDWSAKQEQLISLTPKASIDRNFTSSVFKYSKIITNLIFLGSVILLPGAVIFAGVVAWVIRRRRG
jgi:ABC-type uncharacterized transport system involved in gliding motility auxiliary subunit